MAGLFNKIGRARRIPEKLAQYDDEYLLYCVEKDRVETVLERTLHETDDPKEIIDVTLKTVCEFYGGDWAGVMDIDMDTCLWRPVCWFRAGGATDRTLDRLSGLEDAEVTPRWLESMHSAMPVVLTDTTEIRESNPAEFALYERLDARAILASPFSPAPTGFLVIRNPSRYLNHPEALFIFAYVLHRALAQQNTMEREEIIEAMNPMEQSYDVYPREIYQRGVERKRVELIARDFNEYIVNEPKVSFRNGRYYVMDGQHTIEGCILLNGGADRPILCKVYTGLTMEQEALLFAEQNGHAAPLSAGIKLRAKVVGGDAPSKAFVAATNRVGLSLNYDSMQLSDYRISCVGTALKLYDQLGEEIYCEALRHIVEAWEGRLDSFRAAVLRGVMYFVQLYHGQYSAERLVRALSGVHPMELYRISRDNPAKLPGWRRYVYPIYTTYNGKCRKDALPMKF